MRFLLNYLPFTVFVLVVLVTAVVTYLVFLFRKAKAAGAKPEPDKEGGGEDAEGEADKEDRSRRGKSLELRSAFDRGFQQLKEQAAGRDYRYGIPWLLMLGQRGSRRNDLLARAGLGLPWGLPGERQLASEVGCRWWFADRGLVIDLAGEYVLREDGETSDRVGWRYLLRLLQAKRPKRPIDGVVLTISCRELYQMGGIGDRPAAEAEQKAKRIHEKLGDAQRILGLRFPVYVLVTGCEELPGFGGFAAELPDQIKAGMFGWSSPYGVEIGYRSEWVDEAFAQIKQSVERTQLEMFAEVSEVREADDVFLFPDDLERLKEPLRLYLNQLFQPIVYHEAALLRGIYFCGSDRPAEKPKVAEEETETEAAAAPLELPTAQAQARTFFLRDLFEKKIFRESGLGAPTGRGLVEKNKKLRLAWAGLGLLALLAGWGLYSGYARLEERGRRLEGFLDKTGREVGDLRRIAVACDPDRRDASRVPQALTNAERNRLREGAKDFLAELGELDASKYRSWAIPFSWFWGFNRQLEKAFIEAYDVILFKAMCRELAHKAEWTVARGTEDSPARLAENLVPRLRGVGGLSTPLEEMPDFERLSDFLEELIRLEANVERYNRLSRVSRLTSVPRAQRLEELEDLVGYLFAEDLPDGFHRNADLYEAALERVRHEEFSLAPYRRDAAWRTRQLKDAFYRALFDESPLRLAVRALLGEVAALERQSWSLYDEGERLRQIVNLIDLVDRGLSESSLFWVFREPFDPGPGFDRILAMMQRSELLRPELPGARGLSDQVYEEGRERWLQLRRELVEYDSSGLIEELFEHGGEGVQWQLSREVKVLRTSLDGLLDRPFMAESRAESLKPADLDLGSDRLRWDVTMLEQAVATWEPYKRFLDSDIERFPDNLESSLRVVARRKLDSSLLDQLRRSQSLKPIPEVLSVNPRVRERLLAEEIANLDKAQTALAQLLGILDNAQLQDTREDLAQLLADQASTLLAEVDRLLSDARLYLQKGGDFDWWDVETQTPLAFQAYAVKDEAGLDAYLETQRSRLQELAGTLAKPLVTMLDTAGFESDDYRRWDTILDQLDGYEEKEPGNHLHELEELIRTDLAGARFDNCFEITRTATSRRSTGNFFLDRSNQLKRALEARCTEVVAERAVDGYKRIASLFNVRLKDRYPFAATRRGESPLNEADPKALKDFFRLFDEHQAVIDSVPKSSNAFGSAERDVRRFMARMSGVRKLLAPFLDGEAGDGLPVVDLEVRFRVNRDFEKGGDQVIDWVLTVGRNKRRHPVREPIVRWTLHDPIELELRWAEGSRWEPSSRQDNPFANVVDKTVTYRYDNDWSLISFLQAHQTAKEDGLAEDERLRTFKFAVKTAPDPKALAAARSPERAKVFMRVSLVTTDTAEPSLVLPVFPLEAPRLGQPSVVAEAGR